MLEVVLETFTAKGQSTTQNTCNVKLGECKFQDLSITFAGPGIITLSFFCNATCICHLKDLILDLKIIITLA